MGIGRTWSPDDIAYLEDSWGTVSTRHIAKKLDRSVSAVKQKAKRIGLGDPTLHYEGITVCQLMNALNKSYNTIYVWISKYGMPVKEKLFVQEKRVKVITYDGFWKWAEQYKELLNLAKMEPGILGAEPEWAKLKRSADQARSQKTMKSVAWSESDDQQLRQIVKTTGMTYPKLAEYFNRSEASIKRRLYDLNIKFRPERLNNKIKYTPEETKLLVSMATQGYGYETIAQKLNKSALGVRGKLERMGFDFKRRAFKTTAEN